MLQLIDVFLKQGWQITFASPAQRSQQAMNLSSLEIDEVAIELNDSSFDIFIKELDPDLVMFDRFMIEEQFGWRVAEHCPNALRILDTEDFHSLRKARHQALNSHQKFKEEDLLTFELAKREIASILRCDLSLMISDYEMELLERLFKIDRRILHHIPFLLDEIDNEHIRSWKEFEERDHFTIIGNCLHDPNVDAILQLKQIIWPNIRKKLPQAELHIYVAYATQQINELHNEREGFLIKGATNDPEEVVRNIRVVLAPLRFGAGIKGKLTEAMICGAPSMTTSIGAEGMHGHLPWNGFIEDNPETYAMEAVELYSNKSLWEASQKNGIQLINQLYNKKALEIKLIQRIVDVHENLTAHRAQNFMGSLLQHHTLQSTKYLSKWIEAKNV
ncbi:MAG: glycosyltransferase [Flavobacteriaceae bacterium]|nr:glycosyltransferase [Flavobacteriaceae bacterium]